MINIIRRKEKKTHTHTRCKDCPSHPGPTDTSDTSLCACLWLRQEQYILGKEIRHLWHPKAARLLVFKNFFHFSSLLPSPLPSFRLLSTPYLTPFFSPRWTSSYELSRTNTYEHIPTWTSNSIRSILSNVLIVYAKSNAVSLSVWSLRTSRSLFGYHSVQAANWIRDYALKTEKWEAVTCSVWNPFSKQYVSE